MIRKVKDIFQSQGFKRYFKNTSWLLGERILRIFVGLLVGVWVARYLGPERFGLFSYAQSFVGLFTAIATLGLDGIVIRELVKDENRKDELIGSAFVLKMIGAVLVLVILSVAVNFTSNDSYTNTIVFIVASATIFQSFNVVDMYFQSKVLSKYVVFANIISLIASSLAKITLILSEAPLIAFAWVVLFDSFVLAAGLVYYYVNSSFELKIKSFNFNRSTALSLIKDSWPIILSSAVISVYMKVDQVMVKEMLGAEKVGQYAVAVRLSELWYFIPMLVCSSLFPAVVNAKKISELLYYKRLQSLYNLMMWSAVCVAIPVTFCSDWVVELLYGVEFHEAGAVLSIHIWAGIFVSLGVASGHWYITENLQKLAFLKTFLGMIVNILLNVFLIRIYGAIGAAIATLISQAVVGIIADCFFRETRVVFTMKCRSILLPFKFAYPKER